MSTIVVQAFITLDGVVQADGGPDEDRDGGSFPDPFPIRATRHGAVYRPGSPEVFEELIAPHLTWPERLSVTGGPKWSNTGLHDRHNVLATELGLRAAEHLRLGAVLGEKYATVDLLAASGQGKEIAETYYRRADGVLIRPTACASPSRSPRPPAPGSRTRSASGPS